MTRGLKNIFAGNEVPDMRIVDYSTPEHAWKLYAVLKRQKEIRKRSEVDRQTFNSFVINI